MINDLRLLVGGEGLSTQLPTALREHSRCHVSCIEVLLLQNTWQLFPQTDLCPEFSLKQKMEEDASHSL